MQQKTPINRPTRGGKVTCTSITLTGEPDGSLTSLIKSFGGAPSTKAEPNPFDGLAKDVLGGELEVIHPRFRPEELMRLPTHNNTLAQCIAAMGTNIHGFGWTLEYIGPEEKKNSKEVQAERQRIEDLLNQPNDESSFPDVRRALSDDYETIGYGYFEVGRENESTMWFSHIPAHTTRMTKLEKDPIDVTVFLKRGDDYKPIKVRKRFRRFVQIVNNRRIWFKEFGDPRVVDYRNGKESPKGLDLDEQATEIIMFNRYVPGEAYGLPRYINQLPAILGSRESELTNLDYFENSAIPAMVVTVSGGMLTEETVADIKRHFASKGRDAQNKVLILEAKADPNDASPDGSTVVPTLDIKPLADERQSDGLFQEYDKNNMAKIRSSFRLHSLFLGLSEDHTQATADASLATAESQVFSPERNTFDKVVNDKLLSVGGVPPLYHRFRSNAARIVGSQTIIDSLQKFDEVGAMTPNAARRIFNELFNQNLPLIEEDWGDMPMAMTIEKKKQEQKKMELDAKAKESQQSVTAAKKPAKAAPVKPKMVPRTIKR